jgi:CDP-paratose 2-epimerase
MIRRLIFRSWTLKTAADVLAQEYGKYFGLKTGVLRGGCLTGASHSGVELHGFLSYLVHVAVAGKHYTIFGYKGKQVRDQIEVTAQSTIAFP